jgi:hypothetical protein
VKETGHARCVVSGVEHDEDVGVALAPLPVRDQVLDDPADLDGGDLGDIALARGAGRPAADTTRCGRSPERRRTSTASRGSSGAGPGCGRRCGRTACPRCDEALAQAAQDLFTDLMTQFGLDPQL